MDISSTNLNKVQDIYIDDERLQQTQKTAQNQVVTKNSRDALSQPAADTTKTAQTSTDIVVSSGKKNLNQIVLELSIPKFNEIAREASKERDLGSISTESPLGTQADKNMLPPDVSAKPEF